MSKTARGLTALLVLALTACAPPEPMDGTATAPGFSATSPPAGPTPTVPARSRTVSLWLPPALAPDPQTPSGAWLASRLESFELANPGTQVVVRIKDRSGPGGLLETLSAASRAAPAALPDLIALDAAALNTAALKGLVMPVDGLIPDGLIDTWYDYALPAVQIDDGSYGIPFASEMQLFAYQRELFRNPPRTWADLLSAEGPFLFPAADPWSDFVLAQYLALGGPVRDDAGRLSLDPTVLADVLSFLASARTAGVLPLSVRQFATPEETWAALRDERVSAAVVPVDDFLREFDPEAVTAVPMPTREGSGIALAATWSWALVARDPQQQSLAIELAIWLAQPEFSGPWTERLGLAPTSAEQLDRWSSAPKQNILRRAIPVTRAAPSEEIRVTFGPPIRAAVDAVLGGSATARDAALAAAQEVQP
jgi:ABC-type glycerol-3-phosphate transport system substrate-binding protein